MLKDRGYDPKLAPMYAQMLVGMVAFTGQWWLDARKPKLEEMAAHLVNLAWNGLLQLDPKPRLSAEATSCCARASSRVRTGLGRPLTPYARPTNTRRNGSTVPYGPAG